jgi:hypothetical protein
MIKRPVPSCVVGSSTTSGTAVKVPSEANVQTFLVVVVVLVIAEGQGV